MSYAGLLPSCAAVRQACGEDLTQAPRDRDRFLGYILGRACEIDRLAVDRRTTTGDRPSHLGHGAMSER